MVGCQRTGEAIIVDPSRDITGYLATAQAEAMRLVGIAETHIHADYVSGSRELADRVGLLYWLSGQVFGNSSSLEHIGVTCTPDLLKPH